MTIDGKIYYFGGDGMVANDLYYLDGNAYLADASGCLLYTSIFQQKIIRKDGQ